MSDPVDAAGQIDIDFLLKCVRRFIHETPQESTKMLESLSTRLVDIGLMANAKRTQNCTDWSAAWCALHGDCSCGDDRAQSEGRLRQALDVLVTNLRLEVKMG